MPRSAPVKPDLTAHNNEPTTPSVFELTKEHTSSPEFQRARANDLRELRESLQDGDYGTATNLLYSSQYLFLPDRDCRSTQLATMKGFIALTCADNIEAAKELLQHFPLSERHLSVAVKQSLVSILESRKISPNPALKIVEEFAPPVALLHSARVQQALKKSFINQLRNDTATVMEAALSAFKLKQNFLRDPAIMEEAFLMVNRLITKRGVDAKAGSDRTFKLLATFKTFGFQKADYQNPKIRSALVSRLAIYLQDLKYDEYEKRRTEWGFTDRELSTTYLSYITIGVRRFVDAYRGPNSEEKKAALLKLVGGLEKLGPTPVSNRPDYKRPFKGNDRLPEKTSNAPQVD